MNESLPNQISMIFTNTENILLALEAKDVSCSRQIQTCQKHFRKLEGDLNKNKLIDRFIAAIVGAATAVMALFGKGKLPL